jgi:BirA family biotin operon repressor/biotin-[acetyl-CoA-carboxylase] ligase
VTGLVEKSEPLAKTFVAGSAGWRIQTHEVVTSTNDLAAGLPAWSAVTTARQTGGRGRFGRSFSSGEGGLWLSAVVPAEGNLSSWSGFSLAVGLHLLQMLEKLEVPGARLRWPNDLMAGPKKLGGLLIEQGTRGTLTVGLGLNLGNQPWDEDPSLELTATRLQDVLENPPSLTELLVLSLDAITEAHADLPARGLPRVIGSLNDRWLRCPVRLSLHDEAPLEALFRGLDPAGNLRVEVPGQGEKIIPHPRIEKLTEIQE